MEEKRFIEKYSCWVIYYSDIAAAVFSQRTAPDNFDPSVAIKDFTVQHPALNSPSDTSGATEVFLPLGKFTFWPISFSTVHLSRWLGKFPKRKEKN